MDPAVRSIVVVGVVGVVLGTGAGARADSLWEAEVRAGYGVAVAGGPGMSAAHTSPLTLAATASIAVNEEPALFGFGGVTVETLDRASIGVLGGIRLVPAGSPLRVAAGATWIFAPKTMWGALASGGACHRTSHTMKVCGDLQLTSYFAGTDLPAGHMVTEAQLVLGVVLDAQ
jgi:hypothetical protein